MILDWMQSLTPQQVTLLSTAVGIPLGFVSLAGGALINAHLNRRRDDRIRRFEAIGVATALRAEVTLLRDALLRNSASLKNPEEAGDASAAYLPEFITDVWQVLLAKLPMLDAAAIEKLLYAYGTLPVYMDGLALQAGETRQLTSKRMHVAIPLHNAAWAAAATEAVVPLFNDAINALAENIRHLTR